MVWCFIYGGDCVCDWHYCEDYDEDEDIDRGEV